MLLLLQLLIPYTFVLICKTKTKFCQRAVLGLHPPSTHYTQTFDRGFVQSRLLGVLKIIAKIHAHVNNDGSCYFIAKLLFAQDCSKDGSMVRNLNRKDVTHPKNTIPQLLTPLVSTSFCSLSKSALLQVFTLMQCNLCAAHHAVPLSS